MCGTTHLVGAIISHFACAMGCSLRQIDVGRTMTVTVRAPSRKPISHLVPSFAHYTFPRLIFSVAQSIAYSF
ncbi:hypothetical protein BC827DRAFT_1253661 [Russula dissimulans]|nr:hypothetical protein BC827DRAFT_1253661 [Russula dissimulans]